MCCQLSHTGNNILRCFLTALQSTESNCRTWLSVTYT